jgi:hypothetical protein
MAALALERRGNGWRLQLNGDWSLAAMASIDQELRTLTTPIDAAMVCDWSHVPRTIGAFLQRSTPVHDRPHPTIA